MAAKRGDEREGEDVGVGGEGGIDAERGGEMGRREENMGSGVDREGEGQTEGQVQTETEGLTEELVVKEKSFDTACRHTNIGTRTR